MGFVAVQSPQWVHWDVEPHALDEWDVDMEGTANQWLDMLENVTATAAEGGLLTACDIPFWYDSRNVTRDGQIRLLHEWTLDIVDRVYIMDYRDEAEDIVDKAVDELTYAAAVGKEVVVGVETDCGLEPEYITFCEEGSSAMEEALEAVDAELSAAYPLAYAGLCVHDATAWDELTPAYTLDAAAAVPRDVWSWQTSDWMYAGDAQDAAMEFVSTHAVRDVAQGCIAITLYEQITLARFLNTTAAAGVGVQLLYGGHDYALAGEGHLEAFELATAAAEFTAGLYSICDELACDDGCDLQTASCVVVDDDDATSGAGRVGVGWAAALGVAVVLLM